MKTQNSRKGQKIGDLNTETLIQIEWATVKRLEKMVVNPEVTVKEKTSAANVLAYHMNVLNKLLVQRGEKEKFDEQNLGDFVKGVEPRIFRHYERGFRVWKRALSSKKY